MAAGMIKSVRKREVLIPWSTTSEASIVDVLRLGWYACWQCLFLGASVSRCESRRREYRLSDRKLSTKIYEILVLGNTHKI